ncbi:GNAT family N-acetyltransferase [Paenibacillus filicis]|uniref:GNAT family N-acetyltransferase n=1 Tax=Paenibacillus filicis TaxID=669464 RepID=A0ABU9DYC6_9BACL
MTLLSEATIRIVEKSEIDYMTDRMSAIREREGNPEGVELRKFGEATAFYSRTMAWPSFNTVKGLRDAELPFLEEIVSFFRERERKPQIELVPSQCGQPLLARLHELGWRQTGFHTSLYADPQAERPSPQFHSSSLVEIRELKEEESDLYAAIHCRGTGLPEEGIPYVAANNRVLMKRPGWTFYLASYEGVPAGVGVMYTQDLTASFTFAATLPAYRNQGVHAALLQRRLEQAASQGCTLAVAQAAFLSVSHRNMERMGMRTAYTRAIWTE